MRCIQISSRRDKEGRTQKVFKLVDVRRDGVTVIGRVSRAVAENLILTFGSRSE